MKDSTYTDEDEMKRVKNALDEEIQAQMAFRAITLQHTTPQVQAEVSISKSQPTDDPSSPVPQEPVEDYPVSEYVSENLVDNMRNIWTQEEMDEAFQKVRLQ